MCKENADCGCAKKDPRYPDEVCVEVPLPSPEDIRKIRLSEGLSQWEAAQKFGVSLAKWRQWEGETDKPRVGFIRLIKSLFSKTSTATA